MLIFLIAALAWAVSLLAYDAEWTERGIKAGLAEEANSIVRFFSRTSKPSFFQVFGIELGVVRAPLFLGAVAASAHGNNPLAFLLAFPLVVLGIKNIQGAREWQWMFKHPGQKLPVMNTVWQKIVGFWG